jgi:KUP system potassium uptake protein
MILEACNYTDTIYIAIAGIAEVGVMMISTTLVTLVMLLIWQNNLFMVISFLLIFGSVELIYMSSVLSKLFQGGWLPLAFSTFFLSIMYTWNYGSVLKYKIEVKDTISLDLLHDLGPNLGTVRVQGIGLLYTELVQGIPSIFVLFLLSLPAIHSTIVFVCIKYVPIPIVQQVERFIFRRVCAKEYRMFRCVARYGYKEGRKEDHHEFEKLLIQSLEEFLIMEAQESDELMILPLMRGENCEEIDGDSVYEEYSLEHEISALREAKAFGCTYLLGNGDVRAKKNSLFLKKLVINYFYAFLRRNCRAGTASMRVPQNKIIQLRRTYMV